LENEIKPNVVAANLVVSLQYTLTVDGTVVDSADRTDPLQFIQGGGDIIPGLESQLYGMARGDSKRVAVAPADGYGEVDPEALVEIPRSQFPSEIPVKKGTQLQVQNADGEVMDAYIESYTPNAVRLNFNHPMAGKHLVFDVTVVDLRDATPEELAHGHVHGDGADEGEDEDFAEDELEGEEGSPQA